MAQNISCCLPMLVVQSKSKDAQHSAIADSVQVHASLTDGYADACSPKFRLYIQWELCPSYSKVTNSNLIALVAVSENEWWAVFLDMRCATDRDGPALSLSCVETTTASLQLGSCKRFSGSMETNGNAALMRSINNLVAFWWGFHPLYPAEDRKACITQ